MDQILQNANGVTVVGILLVAIITGSKGMWVFGFQAKRDADRLEKTITDQNIQFEERMKEIRQDRDEWKDIALQATDLGKRVVNVAEKTVR